jgi:hypothetical protein
MPIRFCVSSPPKFLLVFFLCPENHALPVLFAHNRVTNFSTLLASYWFLTDIDSATALIVCECVHNPSSRSQGCLRVYLVSLARNQNE